MADLILTDEDQQNLERAVDQYSFSEGFAPGGAQEVFCKNWPTMKQVLEFLKTILPAPGPIIIDIIIKLGDRLARKCPAPQG